MVCKWPPPEHRIAQSPLSSTTIAGHYAIESCLLYLITRETQSVRWLDKQKVHTGGDGGEDEEEHLRSLIIRQTCFLFPLFSVSCQTFLKVPLFKYLNLCLPPAHSYFAPPYTHMRRFVSQKVTELRPVQVHCVMGRRLRAFSSSTTITSLPGEYYNMQTLSVCPSSSDSHSPTSTSSPCKPYRSGPITCWYIEEQNRGKGRYIKHPPETSYITPIVYFAVCLLCHYSCSSLI